MSSEHNLFSDSEAYEHSMGRLSRVAGKKFLDWLYLPSGLRWLDVGCGTGSFTELLLDCCAPSAISAIDPTEEQIAFAKSKPSASRIDYRQADAIYLPFGDNEFEAAVMALVIQYIPDRMKAMSELTRVVCQGGTVSAYVWPGLNDGHPMQPLNEAVKSIGASWRRRPGSQARTIEALVGLFAESGLESIESQSIEIQIDYRDFDDYWTSQSVMATQNLTEKEIERLKASLQERLPADANGHITYPARANAVKGCVLK